MSTRDHDGPARREQLLGQLARAGRSVSDAVVLFHTAVAEKLELSASDWKTLSLLEQHGPVTHGELVSLSGLAPASITGIVDRLEQGGWVQRRRDPEDGRRVLVELDEAVAAANFSRFFDGLMRRLERVYARYSDDELELLLGLLVEIARSQKEATAELNQDAGDAVG